MPIDQEKGEVRLPFNDNEDRVTRWADARSARVKKGNPGREGRPGGDPESTSMNNSAFFQSTPPGSDVADQETSDQRGQPFGGPMGCGSQFTNDLTPQSIRQGFSRKHMSPTDDNEDGEPFYSEAKVDGKVGYLEKGNVLDRN